MSAKFICVALVEGERMFWNAGWTPHRFEAQLIVPRDVSPMFGPGVTDVGWIETTPGLEWERFVREYVAQFWAENPDSTLMEAMNFEDMIRDKIERRKGVVLAGPEAEL